jgi:hypothetical protein
LQVATLPGSFTVAEPLADYTGDLPAGRWVPVRMPLAKLRSASVYQFRPERLQSVIFHQLRADGKKHLLIVDDIRIDDETADGASAALPVPDAVSAKGFDRHIDVQWQAPAKAPPHTTSCPARLTAGVPARRDTAARRQSLRRLHRPFRRQGELPGRRRRLARPGVGPLRCRHSGDARALG